MEYPDHLAALHAADPALAAQVAGLANLEAILKRLPLAGLDLVQQDEFSYDLLLPLAGEDRWLAFGVT